tara:strand:- start:419 stop:742 length:324 start_codon:yes stop_codon:yes gene_type:complete
MKNIILFIFFALPLRANASDIQSLSEFAGMAQRCLSFYEKTEKPFKAMIMMDYDRKLSERVLTLVNNQFDMNIANARREDGYLLFNGYKDLNSKCSELDSILLKVEN